MTEYKTNLNSLKTTAIELPYSKRQKGGDFKISFIILSIYLYPGLVKSSYYDKRSFQVQRKWLPEGNPK